MKRVYLYLAVVLLFCAWLPAVSFAQTDILPEKTSVSDNSERQTNDAVLPENSVESVSKKIEESPATWISVTVVVMAFAFLLLFFEIAIIPGFGICGITGIILLAASVGIAYWKLTSTLAMIATILAVLGLVFLLIFLFFILPHTKLGHALILKESALADDGSSAVDDNSRYVGLEGVAITNLRPSGNAKILDERVDVITDGQFVDKGTPIKVVKAVAGRVVVAPINDN